MSEDERTMPWRSEELGDIIGDNIYHENKGLVLLCPKCDRKWNWGDRIVHAEDCPDKDFS